MIHCVSLRVCVKVNCRESSREYLATMFRARVILGELARSECSDSGELARTLRLRSFCLLLSSSTCHITLITVYLFVVCFVGGSKDIPFFGFPPDFFFFMKGGPNIMYFFSLTTSSLQFLVRCLSYLASLLLRCCLVLNVCHDWHGLYLGKCCL